MSHPEIILKTTPPRLARTALERDRFMKIWDIVRDRTAIAVIAPSGFGKTTLLLQWRRRWLAQGALVAWLTVDEQDDPARFSRALLHSLRLASGRSLDNVAAMQTASGTNDNIDTLTALLAEIASMGKETVLTIDDVEKLPESTTLQSLVYLLYNAPPNLHVMIGSRQPLPFQTGELAAKGNMAVFKADDLRLQLEESIAILERRFGGRLGLDECVRLHEATEGWPIGLQLAVAAIEPESDLSAAVNSLSGRHSGIERYFIESLFSRLSEPLAGFLTRIVILDRMSAEMCAAVTGNPASAQSLQQLLRDTPILIVAESQEWYRLHPLIRDFLFSRFEKLPADEREALHARACHWFAEREQFPDAASHALAAGQADLANDYAIKSLWTLRTQGKFAEAQAWLDRIPSEAIAGDMKLRLFAAWAMTLGNRNAEAFTTAKQVLADPAADESTRFVAALVASSATGYSDQSGLVPELFERWPEFPVGISGPVQELAYRNGMANLQMHAGRTGRAREILTADPVHVGDESAHLALAFRTMLLGLTHLWDADAIQAEEIVRPALNEEERQGGRRSMVACLHAAVLAAALLERDQAAAAKAVLANRLDVIERTGFPDTILVAYRTLANIAFIQGDERHGLNLLLSLGVLAERRRLPRLAFYSLAEQIRVHALRSRNETAGRLLKRLDDLEGEFEKQEFRPYLPQYRLAVAIARTYAAMARKDHDEAERQLAIASEFAGQLNRKRDQLAITVLQAVLARKRNSGEAAALLAEAAGLARIGGCTRLLADTHPLAAPMAEGLPGSATTPRAAARAVDEPEQAPPAVHADRPMPMRSGPLTPKEAQVLQLLDQGMSNKSIARVMEISDETVKWHLKNVFLKLSTGSRKHAVDRARLLGLVGS